MTAALQSSHQAPSVRLSPCRRRNGTTEPAPSGTAERVPAKPVSPLPQLYYWQAELTYWQLEVGFYHQLLTMEIQWSKPCCRRKLGELLYAFATFKHDILPEMKTALEEILSDNPAQNGWDFPAWQEKIEEHARTFRKLKLEIFPCLSDMLTVTIW